jgi:FGGY-family pentulose kinase
MLINSTGSSVLDYVGGTMSLEMEIPKILWLKRHMPAEIFSQCMFFDLPDYLTYRATTSLSRSNCSLVCKTSFVPPGVKGSNGWNSEFLNQIGLNELVDEGFARIGGTPGENGSMVLTAGVPIGEGLSEKAAEELGLVKGTPVGSGVIDAYAGWIGTAATRYTEHGAGSGTSDLSPAPSLTDSKHRLAAVAGTSTCHVIQSPEGIFVPGVWGPYKNAIFPDWWMNEGGQSSTGQLIDFTIKTHPAYKSLVPESQCLIHTILASSLQRLKGNLETSLKREVSLTELTKDMHFYPDLHGNRSPLADPRMRGSFMGLALDESLDDLALKFNVTLEAIALQTRHILDEMNSKGYDVQGIYMSGGQAANITLMQLLADVCRVPVILPKSHSAAVVLGSAMLGRFAAEVSAESGAPKTQAEVDKVCMDNRERLWEIMVEMTPPGKKLAPSAGPKVQKLLDAKYKIFRESIEIQRRWRKEMAEAAQ